MADPSQHQPQQLKGGQLTCLPPLSLIHVAHSIYIMMIHMIRPMNTIDRWVCT